MQYQRFILSSKSNAKIEKLLLEPGIVRNRLKVGAAVNNARQFLKGQAKFSSFNACIWRFVDGNPIVTRFNTLKDYPPRTLVSDAISKDLIKRGVWFVGSTIIYACVQATGMRNDYSVGCCRHAEVC